MRRLSGIDTAFLYLETPTTHMQVQAVMVLDPSTVPGGYSFEKIKAHLASRLPAAAGVPAPAGVRSVRPAPAGVVRRSRLRPRLPRAPHRGAAARTTRAARRHRRRHRGPSARSVATALGVLGDRGRRERRGRGRRAHAPRDDRRRVGFEPAHEHPRSRSRSRSTSRRPSTTGSPSTSRRTVELRAARDHLAAAPAAAARARAGDAEPVARRDRDHARAPRLEPAVGRHAVQHAAHAVERAAHAASAGRLRIGAARRGEGDEERLRLHGERHRARDRDRRAAAATSSASTSLPDRPLLAACPVSVRNDETADIDSANKVSAMFVSLPTHLDDVDAQIAHIRDATQGREGGAPGGRRAHAARARRARRARAASGWRAGCSAGSRPRGTVPINLVISNVPGPPFPLYLAGARLQSMLPLGPPIEGRRTEHHGDELRRSHRLGLHRVPRARAPSAGHGARRGGRAPALCEGGEDRRRAPGGCTSNEELHPPGRGDRSGRVVIPVVKLAKVRFF